MKREEDKPRERFVAILNFDNGSKIEQLCDDRQEAIGYIQSKQKDATRSPRSYGRVISTEIMHMTEAIPPSIDEWGRPVGAEL